MTRSVPTYELYGELLSGTLADPVHHETIHERSSRHGWTIRLHRHRRLAQVFLFQTPGVRVVAGDAEYQSSGPLLLLMPPSVPHGFRFPPDVVGDVLTLPMDLIAVESAEMIAQAGDAAAILTASDAPHFAAVAALMQQAAATFRQIGPDRSMLLQAQVRLMLGYIRADMRRRFAVGSALGDSDLTRHERQAQAFCDAVEAHFASAMTVADYAAMVGVSAPHLTRICRRILGATPNALVRQRRLVEAKRLLAFTRHSIADVGYRAGFRDTGFFSRTFKAAEGRTPRAFRDEGGV
ncbi:helix-turn-helix domain-containing protein [Thalassococcus sp. BH17M4-6]|uniref:helix-turn-helix domain-containing protein n=1 Tax=Thalassococcus sp. BH17M4-6 TaxID=3413148 RepID=UPI003BDCC5C3